MPGQRRETKGIAANLQPMSQCEFKDLTHQAQGWGVDEGEAVCALPDGDEGSPWHKPDGRLRRRRQHCQGLAPLPQ